MTGYDGVCFARARERLDMGPRDSRCTCDPEGVRVDGRPGLLHRSDCAITVALVEADAA